MSNKEETNHTQVLHEESLQKATSKTYKKPEGSKVKLYKDANSIEIVIPAVLFNSNYTIISYSFGLTMWYVVTNGFLAFIIFIIYYGNFFYKILLILCLSPFWVDLPVMNWLFALLWLSNTKLYINKQQISLTRELFGFKLNKGLSSLRQSISKIEYIKRHTESRPRSQVYDIPTDNQLVEVVIEPEIVIWAGEEKYRIVSCGSFSPSCVSENDINWLSYELSNWLNLPITEKE